MANYSYEAFGKTMTFGLSSSSVQFTGRENDGTGFYYYRDRYYSPIFQRFVFVSEDPVRFSPGDQNLYEYVFNSPINFDDPTGRFPGRRFGRPAFPRPSPPGTLIVYGRYCGIGDVGGKPIDDLDAACKKHDECYRDNGLRGLQGLFNPSDPKKCSKKDECDAELCRAAKQFVPKDYAGTAVRQGAIGIFCK